MLFCCLIFMVPAAELLSQRRNLRSQTNAVRSSGNKKDRPLKNSLAKLVELRRLEAEKFSGGGFFNDRESLLACQQEVTPRRKRYKPIARSEVVEPKAKLTQPDERSSNPLSDNKKKTARLRTAFKKLAHSAGFELTTF